MKKVFLSIVIVAVIAVALGATSLAYAQSSTPQAPAAPASGYGMANGRGPRGGMGAGNAAGTQSGFLHDELIAAWTAKLNLTVDEINARRASRETMSQIAYSTGISVDQFSSLMAEVRSTAIDQAVVNGTITQAQADVLKTRGAGGTGGAGRGMRGVGQGLFANPSCPFFTPTNP